MPATNTATLAAAPVTVSYGLLADSGVETRPLPEVLDPAEDLSVYTTEQLRVLNRSIEVEVLAIVNDHALVDSLSDTQKAKVFAAVELMTRTGAEIMRRDALPTPGPRAVHYEVMPDGSAPVRLTSTILAF